MTTKPGPVPVRTTVPAEYETSLRDLPALTVAVDLASLGIGVGNQWIYDCVLDTMEGTITLLFYPPDEHEGWKRLNEVGEW